MMTPLDWVLLVNIVTVDVAIVVLVLAAILATTKERRR